MMHSIQSNAFRNRWPSLIPNCSSFNFSLCVCVKDCNSERNSSTSLRRCSKLCWFFTSITSLLASNLGRVRVTWRVDLLTSRDISLTQLIWAPLLPNTFLGLNGFFGAVLARLGDVHTFGSAYLEGFCPNKFVPSSLCPCALPWLVVDQAYEFGFQWRTCQTEVFKNENV